MALRLFSSLGRSQHDFRTIEPRVVRMYVCGITPYDVTHLGHAFSYVQFDALRRYLGYLGNDVRYTQNITDIDDDMIMVSRRQGGRPIAEIRDENDAIFRADMDRLNVLRPWAYPRATEHIADIIHTTQTIIQNGCAYVVDGDVFFEAAAFPRYGALNGATVVELARRENPESKREHKKRGTLDFLLWQTTEAGEPAWDSPWGPGRPGWSIECSAMSRALLGGQIDIHGGGRDLMYPHHENEIAQSECASGCAPFCKFWLHNGMLQLDGVKMSKSLGNLVLARNLMDRYAPDHLRLYLLSQQYRQDADYHEGDLDALRRLYERLVTATGGGTGPTAPGTAIDPAVAERLDDDFDTKGALQVLDQMASRILGGSGEEMERERLRAGLATLGFAFAGARGPATGDFTP